MAKKPTAAQVKVLRAMADGTVLVRGYVNRIQWYLQGSGASVNANTANSLRTERWIETTDDTSLVHRYFTLTDAGRTALSQNKSA